MVVFPNCKINLGLSVLRKRPDGFHDLQSVFYPLPFYDALELVQSDKFSITQTGLALDIAPDKNICVRAWQLLKNDYPDLPAVAIHLNKSIPVGAGLGGGSADAAFLLAALNKKFRLGIDEPGLLRYALELGSDCPFFVINKPALAGGRGEQLKPLTLDLSAYALMVVNPGIHISTGEAFGLVTPHEDAPQPEPVIALPVSEWRDRLVNDFEAPAFAKYPEVKYVRDELYRAGALYAAMSGTGSTVFGFFEKGTTLPAFPAHYLVKQF